MADDPDNGERTDVSNGNPLASEAIAVSSSYKVLGELTAADGIGVLGQNNAGSGTPIGVQGVVPNTTDGYGLYTPDDAKIDGDLEDGSGNIVYDQANTQVPRARLERWVFVTTTSDYTASHGERVTVDTASNDVTVTLPNTTDAVVDVKVIDATNTTTIATPNNETIDGQDSITLDTIHEFRTIGFDGTDYWILGA